MKFSDLPKEKWDELQPYLDTCLLPITGLTGSESPWETVEALERLRDAMEGMEKTYVGRIVTYPALHYVENVELGLLVEGLCTRLKTSGFKYIVAVTADSRVAERLSGKDVPKLDLFLTEEETRNGGAVSKIGMLWQQGAPA